MFFYKSGFNNKFKARIHCRSQKLRIVASSKINSTRKINSTLNHLNIIKSILKPIESLLTI